jgi:pimeloyl-ACP methyl ester carboxylesterase
MAERMIDAEGVELCTESFGEPGDPPILLIMGTGASMLWWDEAFCRMLADGGRYVIRYDHRDTGGSTTYPPGEPGYTGDDLVSDPVRILDALGIERAHLAGISMGGAIVQRIAVEHPDRVRSIALLSTSSAGTGGPELPPASAQLRALFRGEGVPPAPDWADREAVIEYLLANERPYAGPRGIDEDAMRELLGRVFDRSPSLPSADNHALVDGSDMPHARLAEISVPAVVIHGTHDPLFPPAHGEELARAIPRARLVVVEELGHELPRWAWDDVLPELIAISRDS